MTADSHRAGNMGSGLDTRDRLLRCTATILASKGYGQTRLRDIAALAGVRSPAIYYHFASRDELVAATLCVGQQRLRQRVQAAIHATGGPWHKLLAAAVTAHLDVQLEMADFARAVSRNAGHGPAVAQERIQAENDAYHDVWRALLQRGRESGDIRDDLDLSVARMLVIGALNWAVEWWTPDRPFDELAATSIAVITAALSA